MSLRTRRKAKLYESENWLRKKLLNDGYTPAEISIICKVSEKTIYEYIKRFGIII